MKIKIFFLLLVFLSACKGSDNKQEKSNADSTAVRISKTEYTCPMHPEIISDKSGQCPNCGMDLEIKS